MADAAPVVVITGATAGVGRAIALRFGQKGFGVGLIARDQSALEELRAELQALGAQSVAIAADVADAGAVFEAAERFERELGPVAIWINNAMLTVVAPFAATTPDEFRRVTDATYLGFVHGTMAALARMRPRDRGHVVQIGSALAYRGIPLQAAYCGAKHAIRGFSESVRSELVHDGSRVRLTMIDLPAVNTPQFDWSRSRGIGRPRPMGTPVQPQVVADAVFRAANGRGGDRWIGWTTALTVLGNAVAPWFLDRRLAGAVEGQQRPGSEAGEHLGNLAAPVPGRHRVEGSFSDEAAATAPLLRAGAVRLGVIAAGALVCGAVGWMMRGASRRR